MTNNTSTRCSERGDPFPGQEVWWIYIVVFVILYITYLGLSLLIRGLRLITKKCRLLTMNPNQQKASRKFNETVRLLLSGDSILSKTLILVTFACNSTFIILALYRSIEPPLVEYCYNITQEPARIVELCIVLELLCFSIARLLASNNIVWHWFDLYTIVDVLTLPHIFVSVALGVDWLGLRSARFFWLTQLITVFRFIPWIKSQNFLDFFALAIYFLTLLSLGAGIIHLLEYTGDPWINNHNPSKHNIFSYGYYILVTVTTVGYGDITPKTAFGRGFMFVYIIIGLAFFAALLPLINDVLQYFHFNRLYSSFDRSRVPRHVIVCGHITAFTAQDFLKDFLHPDRGDSNTHVLFLHPTRPSRKLRNVFRCYYTRVQYIAGSVLDRSNLLKSKLLSSSAVFILADKYTNNPLEEDNGNLLRLVSIKNTTTKIPVIIQLLLGSSKKQVKNIEGWNPGSDIAVCLNELKLGLLAQSCLCPGFSTLIANLFYTSDFPALKSFEGPNAWKEGYTRGASNEIYPTHFSPSFEGKNFQEAARICYNQFGLILLAFESPEGKLRKFDINPPNSEITIQSGLLGTRGYFVGQDVNHVSVVSSYCETCDKNLKLVDHIELKYLIRRVSRRNCNCPVLTKVVTTGRLEGTELVEFDEASVPTGIFSKQPSHCPVSFTIDHDDDEEASGSYSREPIELEEVTLNSNAFMKSPEGIPNLENHIVVCVFADEKSPLLGLQNFLIPLRAKSISRESIKPVVIVSNSTFLKCEWPFIQNFPEVYVIEGCPLYLQNLEAASIDSCSVCIITTMLSADSDEPAINDKEVVLCSLSIQKYLKRNAMQHVQIIADLRQESNVQFLDFGDEDEPDERIYKAQPFACGEAFSVSMMDSVTSSAFHSPGTLYLVEDLIQCTGTKATCQIVGVPLNSEEYANKTFQDLYNLQLDKNNLVLGLYRRLPAQVMLANCNPGRSVSSVVGISQDKHYVITAPKPGTLLDEMDIAFVLVNKTSTPAELN